MMLTVVISSLRHSKCVRLLQPLFCCSICIRHVVWTALLSAAILLLCIFSRITFLLYNSNLHRYNPNLRSLGHSENSLHGHFDSLYLPKKGKVRRYGARMGPFRVEALMQKNATPLHVHYQEKLNQRLLKRNTAIIRLSSKTSQRKSIFLTQLNLTSGILMEFIKNNFDTSTFHFKRSNKTSNSLKKELFWRREERSESSPKIDITTFNVSIEEISTRRKLTRRKNRTFTKVSFVELLNKNEVFKSKINLVGKESSPFNHTTVDFAIDPKLVKEEVLPLYLQEYLNRKLQQDNLLSSTTSKIHEPKFIENLLLKENSSLGEPDMKEILFKSVKFVDHDVTNQTSSIRLKICPKTPLTLEGHLDTNLTLLEQITVDEVMEENRMVLSGGFWSPRKNSKNPCLPRHKVAIIIPYRDRLEHLLILLSRLHRLLRNQQLEYSLFVVEQFGNTTFNKGSLMNAGFMEAWKTVDASCFIFHDVDLLPEDDRNMYSCPPQPRHLSVAVDTFNYVLPYHNLVGGVLNMKGEHFFSVNGYSNLFWGWGGEDDDMSNRMKRSRLTITRPPQNIARYTMIKHTKRHSTDVGVLEKLMRTSGSRFRHEGLNTQKYEVVSMVTCPLFTHLLIDVGFPPSALLNSRGNMAD